MSNKKNRSLCLLLFFCLLIPWKNIIASELVNGDKDASIGQTFSFPVAKYKMSFKCNAFYVSAHPTAAGSSKEFALSILNRGSSAFNALAVEKVELDGKSGENNPLFNAGINFLDLLEIEGDQIYSNLHSPVVVTTDKPEQIFVINRLLNLKDISILSKKYIVDANGESISSIHNLGVGDSINIFAAVRNKEGEEFGEDGSGIAYISLGQQVIKSKGNRVRLEEDNKSSQETKNKKSNYEEIARREVLIQWGDAIPLDKSSNVVKIDSDIASMFVSDMYWDKYLKRLYIALKVQAGADGAKALVVGRLEGQKLILQSIAPDTVFENQDEIVGAKLAGSFVSLHKVRTMFASTWLRYLIILGGNGDPSDTKRTVYALPLVNNPDSKTSHGTLADINADCVDKFSGTKVKVFNSRILTKKAESNLDILKSSDEAARVGGGELQAGDVTDIFVYGDAVYAVVADPEENQKSGVFMSRALLDEKGKIKRWTNWKRVENSDQIVFGADFDAFFGNFITLSGDVSSNVKTVKRTVWGDGSESGLKNLSEVLNAEFRRDIDGIQGLFEFPYDSVGLPRGLKNIALLAATGFKKVVLAEMGKVVAGTFERNTGNFSTNQQKFSQGKITSDFPVDSCRIISISGGALDSIGPVQATEITASNGTARLFVGGIGGLAMLVKANDGTGWSVDTDLGPNFAGLTNNMLFKKVGEFSFVRKLVFDDHFLYVLTDTKLYRIDLEASDNNFIEGKLNTMQLAAFTDLLNVGKDGTFLDFVVSDKLGVIATSAGLFRVGNGKDIKADNSLEWTNIKTPGVFDPIKQLIPMSKTLLKKDFARDGTDGNLYVLSGFIGKNISQINRFSVRSGDINDQTILPLPDFFIEMRGTNLGSHSYFLNYGSFKKLIEEDGALRFNAVDRDLDKSALLGLLSPRITSDTRLPELTFKKINLPTEHESDICNVLRSMTGPVLVGGNFGIMFNE